MTTYFEYGVNLTDNQKRSLASAMNNRAPLTLRLKHSNLTGNDELMLTKTQLKRIQKSLNNGTGADIKISKTQIGKVAKQGGSLFFLLARLGARVLPYAVKGISTAVPAVATGAVSALGSLGIDKIFGKGINIPKKFFPMLPSIVNELTSSQIDQINKVMQSGGRLMLKPTRKQVEGGFLGTLASIGIPIAIELVSKIFGKGLQVDKTPPPPPPNTYSNVYLPQSGGQFPMYPPPFYGNWGETIGMGKKTGKVKKTGKGKKKGQGLLLGKKQSFQRDPNSWKHFVNKPLSNFDLEKWIDDLGIKYFRSIYSRDRLPDQIRKKECGIINLDSIEGQGTHWVCYRNIDKQMVEYFDPFGLIIPHEIHHYLAKSGKKVIFSQDEIQKRDTVLCGCWCLYYLIERQKGKSILDIIHHEDFDSDNSDFIKDYFINHKFLDQFYIK